jgi:hypothetical protein
VKRGEGRGKTHILTVDQLPEVLLELAPDVGVLEGSTVVDEGLAEPESGFVDESGGGVPWLGDLFVLSVG